MWRRSRRAQRLSLLSLQLQHQSTGAPTTAEAVLAYQQQIQSAGTNGSDSAAATSAMNLNTMSMLVNAANVANVGGSTTKATTTVVETKEEEETSAGQL